MKVKDISTRTEEKLTKRENSIEDKLQSIAEREAKIDKQKAPFHAKSHYTMQAKPLFA